MKNRVASFAGLVVTVVSVLGSPSRAAAQQGQGQVVKLGEGETLTITGFINATFYNDRGFFGFGDGQNAEFANPAQESINQGIVDGDVRNTRLNFTFAAPPVLGKWAPRATIEVDFFGAFASLPPFGDEQPQLRVRHAYVDFSDGRTTLRIGQYWAPFFNTDAATSLVHIAFPFGLGSGGQVGWRYPGVQVYHDLTTTGPFKLQWQVAAMKGSGPLAVGNANDAANNVGTGEASGAPQLETRLNVSRKFDKVNWFGYVAYHIDWKRPTGTGVAGSNITDWGGETGQNVTVGSFTLHGNFYTGKGLGTQFGAIAQTQPQIHSWGAWAQAGYDLTSHWSIFADYGMDQPDYARFATETGTVLARQLSHIVAGMLRFRAGRYAVSLEEFRAVTRYSTGIRSADQYALSTLMAL